MIDVICKIVITHHDFLHVCLRFDVDGDLNND